MSKISRTKSNSRFDRQSPLRWKNTFWILFFSLIAFLLVRSSSQSMSRIEEERLKSMYRATQANNEVQHTPQKQKKDNNSVDSKNNKKSSRRHSRSESTAGQQQHTALSMADEPVWETTLSPKVVWLASYPNSGTSYTMTMVERASNFSTASNYGTEVTYDRDDALPIYPQHPEGPFWEGLSGKMGAIRDLPTGSVLTKTHCGSRCIKCDATEYKQNAEEFIQACQRTTHRLNGERVTSSVPANAIQGVVHLLRNPFHNTVARFHLERRNMIEKLPDLASMYPSNATGFGRWCAHLDRTYSGADRKLHTKEELNLFAKVPCHAEFYKYTQWHNLLIEGIELMKGTATAHPRPVQTHVVFYEDYSYKFNQTVTELFDFLDLPVVQEFREFRSLPSYEDHFTVKQRTEISELVKHVATDETWSLLSRYFQESETATTRV